MFVMAAEENGMFLSIYTFVRDGLRYDFHVVEMLKHHLPLADEIIVNEGYSRDGTFEAISAIHPKIRVFRSEWGEPSGHEWFRRFKNEARKRCQGKWCILLDCDEFIPDWEFDLLREYLHRTSEIMIPVDVLNFYGNYKVYNACPEKIGWPARKMIIHRNLPEIEVWGDGANIRLEKTPPDLNAARISFTVHHFGAVRHPARLREKWRKIQFGNTPRRNKRHWFNIPSFVFDWLPHDWGDPQFLADLAVYDGPYIKAVRENPGEFVRDRFRLYERVKRETGASVDKAC
jgi:glycosyltransferase involved in cell wall biosynthesis